MVRLVNGKFYDTSCIWNKRCIYKNGLLWPGSDLDLAGPWKNRFWITLRFCVCNFQLVSCLLSIIALSISKLINKFGYRGQYNKTVSHYYITTCHRCWRPKSLGPWTIYKSGPGHSISIVYKHYPILLWITKSTIERIDITIYTCFTEVTCNWVIVVQQFSNFQLFHGENKLIFNEMMIGPLFSRPTRWVGFS